MHVRFRSVDILRGAVMVLMAIDHVRVYAAVPPGGPTFGLFFTRWITHFCAPAFLFFAGTSAFLSGQHRSRGDLARFLATRGIWLVLLELTVVRFCWTFNADVQNYLLAGVIWAIGWSMIGLALLVRLPAAVVGAIGVVIIAGHNLLGPWLLSSEGPDAPVAAISKILYLMGDFRLGGAGPRVVILYTLIPWFGVMAAGYGFGQLLLEPEPIWRRTCLAVGLGGTALFLILRYFNLYGDPRPWDPSGADLPAAFSFLNTAKYPASLLFLLMTLGPMIAVLPWLESARGRLADWLAIFGRVPLFYYLLHIPLIHLAAVAVSLIRTGAVTPWLFANHPMEPPPPPEGYPWSLGLLYLVTAIVVVALYFPCRWYAEVRTRRRDWWTRLL